MVHFNPPTCLASTPDALARVISADPALAERWQRLPRRRFDAGSVLLRAGDAADKVWLVHQGLVRLYFLSAEGIERNKSFHAEGAWIAGGMPPRVVPSLYTVEALEPVEAVELSYEALVDCVRDFPVVKPVVDDALGCVFAGQAVREAELLMQDAATRYRRFVEERPELAARVPLHHVASHLGITNVALSRIRSRLGMVRSSSRSPSSAD